MDGDVYLLQGIYFYLTKPSKQDVGISNIGPFLLVGGKGYF